MGARGVEVVRLRLLERAAVQEGLAFGDVEPPWPLASVWSANW
ncbi:hypothetical protein RKD23_004757 [Streptomyces sp. SAI-170]